MAAAGGGRHYAGPADQRSGWGQPRRPGGRGAGARGPRGPNRSGIRFCADGDLRRRLHPATISSATFPIAGPAFPDQNIWDGGFDASWELDLFGRVRRNVQAQGAFVAVNQEDLRDVQVSLTAELARAYFELRGAQEQLSVAQRRTPRTSAAPSR